MTTNKTNKFGIHIPHSSSTIPDYVQNQFCISDEILKQELLELTDWYTDDLFDSPDFKSLKFSISRFVIDVERFANDDQEIMSSRGMGVIYTHGVNGNLIRNVSDQDRTNLLSIYQDHHNSINRWACESLFDHNRCILIDAHSFPNKPLPCDLNQSNNRPDICIGTDDFHTPLYLQEFVISKFSELGYKVGLNSPYSGTLVPSSFWKSDSRVNSIMIEINRSLYLNQDGSKSSNYDSIKLHIQEVLIGITLICA